ncbi:hypothetical protein VT84_24680 [Gemmata sp. SH-PL17]|uniref:hypothetical protein n=1 Tax=Gemmata sp. SH-PL17 TaxID=1630693 RepID=UPI00078BBB42|nr:hypothetical protein [Gemmata sp. SH-PL17]AMV27621.1 hypothetical protein VT84_24680 [Gemmata sp. SH-PL17]
MPPKTNTELIQELVKTVAEHSTALSNLEIVSRSREEASAQLADETTELARRTSEHLIRLEGRVEILTERDAAREREINRFRDEDAALRKENADLRRELAEARQETAVLKQQLQDHVAQYQEWDKRRWGLIVLLLGAVLSLASGLIVTLAKK